MREYGSNINLPSLDNLFSSEQERQDAKLEKIQICLFVCFSINCHSEYFNFEPINIWFYTIYFWCKSVYFCNLIH